MSQTHRLTSYKCTVATDANGATVVTCHNTVIVRFNATTVSLNSGGWRTRKTKDDMNRAASQFNLPYRVHQSKGRWYVSLDLAHAAGTVPFEDGMTFTR